MKNLKTHAFLLTKTQLKSIRKKNGWTVPQMAEVIGCNWRTLENWLNGRNKPSAMICGIILEKIKMELENSPLKKLSTKKRIF